MITKFIKELFFGLDKIIYGLIDDIYGLLLQLTRTSIFDQDVIHSFSIRIYALIGIFMLFKVSISLLTYLINPDEFASKEKGFGIVIRNVILSLVILVIAPYAFNEAFEVQSMILEENTIMNLIFGTPSSSEQSAEFVGTYLDNYVNEAGGKIQFTLLYAFAQPNYEEFAHDKLVADLNACRDTYAKDADGNFVFRKKAVIKNGDEKVNAGKTSNYIYELNDECFGVYDSEEDSYKMDGSKGQLWKAYNSDAVNAGIAYQNYAQGVAQQSFSLFFTKDAILAKTTDDRYLINYKWGISTAVGVAVLYFFIMFCIDVAIRSVKLGFLEMIAPIPIISYCDPKSGKDGMFKKWFDMLWKTYLELFMRLFALYFGIYVLSIIGTFRDVVTGDIVNDFFVNVFMIVGILIFIKKLPEILKEVFNLKGDGKFEFNPFKRFENDAFGGKAITGAAAGLVGGTVGALSGAGLARGITAGIGGAFGNKGWSETWKNTRDKNAKYRTANLVDRNPVRRTFHRASEGISGAIGSGGHLAQIERREAELNRDINNYKGLKENLEASIAPIKTQISRRQDTADKIKAIQDRGTTKVKQGVGEAGKEYQARMRAAAGVRESSAASGSIQFTDRNGAIQTFNWSSEAERGALATRLEQEAETFANKEGRDHYINNENDAVINNIRVEYAQSAAVSGVNAVTTAEDLDSQSGSLLTANAHAKADIAQQEQSIANYDDMIKEANDKLRDVSDEKKRYESYKVN